MDIVDDWGRKSYVSSSGESLTPSFSNPSDSQLLFSSPSLSPPILSTITHLTPSRFLTVSGVPPSVSSKIESSLRIPHPNDDAARLLSYNRLQFLPLHRKDSVLLLFPTGTDLDQLGFLILSTADHHGGLRVVGPEMGGVFKAMERFFTRILKVLVQPISDSGAYKCSSSSSIEFGYVLVYSLYSIHWYCVKYNEYRKRPALSYLGSKQFKRCSIINASWSSHLPGECLVLLENGDIFMFDLSQRHSRVRGCRLKVSWECRGNRSWIGCEFGCRPGSFIVARSDAVFVITRRSCGDCSVRSLLETESLSMTRTEELVAFARAGSDSFRFILASRSYVFLCDERSGVPLLKWQHDVEKPCFVDAFSASDLGFQADESTCYCVVIGSFWNAQSQMFCYGPVAKDPSSLCVWELPHNILLPAGKCLCGDCVVREIITKESLPVWINWQKKRVLVLGFGVLNKYIPLGSSGFTLIQLTSSGKLEAVKFRASRDPLDSEEVIPHVDPPCKSEEVNLLYFPDDDEYKFPKRFKYLELEYLSAHIKGDLARFLNSRLSEKSSGFKKSSSFSTIREELREMLETCGFGSDRCSSTIIAVFENVDSPTIVFDIALREIWSTLPIELLSLAFSSYSKFEDVRLDKKETSLEFLVVPEFRQLPPFSLRKPSTRSSKWSKKEKPGVELVGPILPLPVLLTLHEFSNGCADSEQEYSPEVEFSDRLKQISKAAREIANSGAEESQEKQKRFIAYTPMTTASNSDRKHQELDTFVSKVRHDDGVIGERTGLELFDDLSPVEMCFEERNVSFDTKALLTSKTLLSMWQTQSASYTEFLSQYHLKT